MGQTLTNGIYLPAEGEVRCYNGLASNWTALDAVVGGYRAHVANENIHITSAERSKWNTGVTQAYVLRYANTSLTALGTVAFSALDNTDNIKIGDKVLDSEGKLFALTAVDTANSSATLSALLIDLSKDSDLSNYYTKGETDNLLSDKADDLDVLHRTGDESSSGKKQLNTYLTLNGNALGNEFSNNARTCAYLTSNRDTIGKSGVFLSKFRQNRAQGSMSGTDVVQVTYDVLENEVRSNRLWYLNFIDWSDDVPQTVELRSLCNKIDYKLTHINALNPGVLSMPNLSAGVDISGYLTNAGTTTPSEYTPTVDGWLVIAISADNPACIRVFSNGGIEATAYSERNELGSTSGGTYARYAALTVPCRQNDKQNIIIMPGTMGIVKAMFYPCMGNV